MHSKSADDHVLILGYHLNNAIILRLLETSENNSKSLNWPLMCNDLAVLTQTTAATPWNPAQQLSLSRCAKHGQKELSNKIENHEQNEDILCQECFLLDEQCITRQPHQSQRYC